MIVADIACRIASHHDPPHELQLAFARSVGNDEFSAHSVSRLQQLRARTRRAVAPARSLALGRPARRRVLERRQRGLLGIVTPLQRLERCIRHRAVHRFHRRGGNGRRKRRKTCLQTRDGLIARRIDVLAPSTSGRRAPIFDERENLAVPVVGGVDDPDRRRRVRAALTWPSSSRISAHC